MKPISFVLLVVACMALHSCGASTTCKDAGQGYFCIDSSTYAFCNQESTKEPELHKCHYPSQCRCGKAQTVPCSWPFQKMKDDCQGQPGDFVTVQAHETESKTMSATGNKTARAATNKRVVSYFDNWSQYHTATLGGQSCRFMPTNIDGSYVTNIMYAFAVFDSNFNVKTFEWNDEELYSQVIAKKRQYPHIKVSLAIGGWNFNLHDETKHLYSEMASTKANRQKFIKSAIAFAHKYSFDGIDIDWEYPGWEEQGGQPRDTENFSLLLKEFREAIDADTHATKLLFTVASPAGEEKIKLIQLDKIHQYGLLHFFLHETCSQITLVCKTNQQSIGST